MISKKLLLILSLIIFFILLFVSWYDFYVDNKVTVFAKADKIEVLDSKSSKPKFIYDKNIIKTLTNFLSSHNGGWQTIVSYHPAVNTDLVFYKDGKIIGSFGMSESYVTIESSVYFKELSATEIDKIYNIVQVTKRS